MIYNVSILQGYTALIGTSMIHLPMLITQLVFIRIPDNKDDVTPEATMWYWLAAFMHFALFSIHIATTSV